MSTDNSNVFNKENLDKYLKELAKEYKKLGGKNTPAEIILIGGAAIIENYSFRDMTTDIDAIISASSAMKEAITKVGDSFNLPYGWLNTDFVTTASYSPKILQYSVYYKTFNQILSVRTISSEYLVAMKLKSGRKFKNDLSDIVGILSEHKKRNDEISYDRIDKAIINLYGSWDEIPFDSIDFIKDTISNGNYEEVYSLVRKNEKEAKHTLIDFQKDYPDVLDEENVDSVLEKLQRKKDEEKHSL